MFNLTLQFRDCLWVIAILAAGNTQTPANETLFFSTGFSRANQEETAEVTAADRRKIAALMRLTKIDVNQKPTLKKVVVRFLKSVDNEAEYLRYAQRFRIPESHERLGSILQSSTSPNNRVAAIKLLLEQLPADDLVSTVLNSARPADWVEPISLASSQKSLDILKKLVTQRSLGPVAKTFAAKGLGRQEIGQRFLLELVKSQKLPTELQFTTANLLLSSNNPDIKSEASKLMKLPATAGSKPLPPISTLVKQRGNVDNGKTVFDKSGTCANCHKVQGQGKEVGPDLSEIGSKLSRQAMYESILNPSAAVSHNYENYLVQTIDGLSFSGVLVSETADKVVIRTAEALTREIPVDDLDGMRKSPQSLMPNDLQKNFSQQDLIDLVEYLMSLKKK